MQGARREVQGEYSVRKRARCRFLAVYPHPERTGTTQWITAIRPGGHQCATCEHGEMKGTASMLHAGEQSTVWSARTPNDIIAGYREVNASGHSTGSVMVDG